MHTTAIVGICAPKKDIRCASCIFTFEAEKLRQRGRDIVIEDHPLACTGQRGLEGMVEKVVLEDFLEEEF